MLLQKNDRLLMIGDSITDCGRTRMDFAGLAPSLGSGYVSMVARTLHERAPELNIRITNKGISGNTTRDLLGRWQEDVLDLEPDWLSIMIGINDVWRQFDRPDDPEAGVPLAEYKANLESLIEQAQPVVTRGIILLTPYFIEPDRREPMRAMMDQFTETVKAAGETHNLPVADTQASFDKALETVHPLHFCADRVHPIPHGHCLIAEAFLDTIGLDR